MCTLGKLKLNYIEARAKIECVILVTRASDLMAAHDPSSCAKEKSSGVEIVKCVQNGGKQHSDHCLFIESYRWF